MRLIPRRLRLAPRHAAVAIACVAVIAPVACSDGDRESAPPPDEASSSTTTSPPIDYSQVALAPVNPGKPPPVTRPPGGGKSSIAGRVLDASGAPVPQALVRASYYANPDKPEIIEVLSGDDGAYRFDRIYGGRWRVRAWKPPIMATLEQPSFFLAAGEQKTLDLKVKLVPDVEATSNMAPNPPLVGWPAELAVLLVTQTVDPEGKVVRTPVVDMDATFAGGDRWKLDGPAVQRTNAEGTVRWIMYCDAEGVHAASVTVAGREFPLKMPSCLSPASTTTTVPTTVAPGGETTTTRRKTTTTTRRSTTSTRPPIAPR